MSENEAYAAGFAAGEVSANHADFCLEALPGDYDRQEWEVPARYMPTAEDKGYGRARADWERGTRDGWQRHFEDWSE